MIFYEPYLFYFIFIYFFYVNNTSIVFFSMGIFYSRKDIHNMTVKSSVRFQPQTRSMVLTVGKPPAARYQRRK